MSVEQVKEAAVRVVSETGHVRGLEEITGVFDKGEVALILACGVRKYQEYQALKGKREAKTSSPIGSCKRNSAQTKGR